MCRLFALTAEGQITLVNVTFGNDRYRSFKPHPLLHFHCFDYFQHKAQRVLFMCVFCVKVQNCHIFKQHDTRTDEEIQSVR